jgi:hypothetical protein
MMREITVSGELPIGSEIKFLEVYTGSVSDVAEVGVAAVDHAYLSHLLALIQLLLLLIPSIILLLPVLVLTLVLVKLISLLRDIIAFEAQPLVGLIVAA